MPPHGLHSSMSHPISLIQEPRDLVRQSPQILLIPSAAFPTEGEGVNLRAELLTKSRTVGSGKEHYAVMLRGALLTEPGTGKQDIV